jgi:hypothetical protein
VVATLRSIPFEAATLALSCIAAEVFHHGRDARRQIELAAELHDARMLARIERFVREDPSTNVVFDPRLALALQRLLIVYGADATRGLTDTEVHRLSRALVDLAGALPTSEPSTDNNGEIGEAEGWARYIAQVGAWYDEPYVLEAIARAYTMFGEIADEPGLVSSGDRAEIDLRLRDAYGLGLAEQFGVGLACAALTHAVDADATVEQRFTSLEPGFLSESGLADVEDDAIALVSATRDESRATLIAAGETPEQVAWDHSIFEMSPFLRLSNGQLRLYSPRALVSWMTRGVHYRLLDAAGRGLPKDRARAARGRFLTFTGALGEEYVRQIIGASLHTARAAGAVRVHGEVEFRVGKDRLDGPDLVIDAGPDLVMVEVYSGRMSLRARTSGSSDELLGFVNRSTAEKLSELADRTRDLLAGHLCYPGTEIGHVRRIWPVLVLAGDGMTQSPLLWAHLRAVAPEAFVDDARMRRPVICDLDDLDALLALAEEGHHLPDLLGMFVASGDEEHSPRRWVGAAYGLERRPTFVKNQFQSAMDAARVRAFPRPAGG